MSEVPSKNDTLLVDLSFEEIEDQNIEDDSEAGGLENFDFENLEFGVFFCMNMAGRTPP